MLNRRNLRRAAAAALMVGMLVTIDLGFFEALHHMLR
jgi:hypothetical protein